MTEVRELHQLMTAYKVLRGTFANSGIFTAEAREFAKANGINTMNRLGLLALISQRTMRQKEDLLQLAYQDEYCHPRCGTHWWSGARANGVAPSGTVSTPCSVISCCRSARRRFELPKIKRDNLFPKKYWVGITCHI
ncbi:MAG: restriction endonuclease [Ramlibacter sp.]|nr:restriction endonuclease [Ramlibacter sp.]